MDMDPIELYAAQPQAILDGDAKEAVSLAEKALDGQRLGHAERREAGERADLEGVTDPCGLTADEPAVESGASGAAQVDDLQRPLA